jgi:hypothetical protein
MKISLGQREVPPKHNMAYLAKAQNARPPEKVSVVLAAL